ncbi:MAG: fused MFS/spermidine synthase [Pirellulales bacterium]
MTGLSYEVIWFKQFSHVWGSSTLAMASVVGSFLLGLGIGARCGGAIADRVARPVVWYGVFEIGVGGLALLIPTGTNLVWRVSVDYYSSLRDFPIAYALLRCATTLAVIGPSCVLMGATLPLMVRQFASRSGLGQATGWLYGINTLGAALGCYLVGFHVLPELGLFWTNVATAMANLAVGIAAISTAYRLPLTVLFASSATAPAADARAADSRFGYAVSVKATYVVAGLVGCAGLMLQTVWNRQLALVLGSSTYAFTAVLFVILAGIGTGSLLLQKAIPEDNRVVALLFYVVAGLVFSTIVGVWLLPFVADCVGLSIPLRTNGVVNALVYFAASMLLVFLPAMAMGALFPILVQCTRRSAARAGFAVGTVYACNTVGALVGAVGTSVWLVPTLGTRLIVSLALVLYLVPVALLVADSGCRSVKPYLVMLLVGLAVAQFSRGREDPRLTNMGMFLYGYSSPAERSAEVLFYEEGASCNVLVTKQGDSTSFRVNGKVDGSSHGDMAMQLGLAYFPRFLNPDAQNVLVVGFGTGTTCGTALLFPESRVTCCEIEPAIVAAAPHFAKVNHEPLKSPHFTVVYDDARAYVQGTADRYDLILSEPSNPWIAGVSNLFTAEFYWIASRKLAPNGIFAQWIQTYCFSPQDYAMIVRTMRDVFPHHQLVRISNGDTILLASNQPLDRDATAIEAAQQLVDGSPAMQSDLNRYFGTTDVRNLLLTRIVLDEGGLQRLVAADGSERRNLDRNMQLEFTAARHLYQFRGDKTTERSILAAARAEWFIEGFDRLGCGARQVTCLHELIGLFSDAGFTETAAAMVEFGLRTNPHSPELLADQILLKERLDLELLDRLLASSESSVCAQGNRVGVECWRRKQFGDATTVFDRLCTRFPTSATLWTNLAINYDHLGQPQKANSARRRAMALDPTGFEASMPAPRNN